MSDSHINETVQSLDEAEVSTVTLVSKEGKKFKVNKEYARLSVMLKNAMSGEDADEIPLSNISSLTLGQVVEYLNIRKGTAPSEIKRPLPLTQSSRDFANDNEAADFIDRVGKDAKTMEEVQDLTDLIGAANFLMIDPLLQLGCAKYSQLGRKSPVLIEYYAKLYPDTKAEKQSASSTSPASASSTSPASASSTSPASASSPKKSKKGKK